MRDAEPAGACTREGRSQGQARYVVVPEGVAANVGVSPSWVRRSASRCKVTALYRTGSRAALHLPTHHVAATQRPRAANPPHTSSTVSVPRTYTHLPL